MAESIGATEIESGVCVYLRQGRFDCWYNASREVVRVLCRSGECKAERNGVYVSRRDEMACQRSDVCQVDGRTFRNLVLNAETITVDRRNVTVSIRANNVLVALYGIVGAR